MKIKFINAILVSACLLSSCAAIGQNGGTTPDAETRISRESEIGGLNQMNLSSKPTSSFTKVKEGF